MKKALTWNAFSFEKQLSNLKYNFQTWKLELWKTLMKTWKQEVEPFYCPQPSPSVLCSCPCPSQTFSAYPYPSSAENIFKRQKILEKKIILKIYLGEVIRNVKAQVHVILGCNKIFLRLKSKIVSLIEMQQSKVQVLGCVTNTAHQGGGGACLRLIY